ncbi:hypothetical protein [Skermania piniformis]|uniref:Low molecular weight antigen MTB12-like C-terminal domain-containing protein n=1 Tax=Skermania pinensis TaxID=39122 RepID=A0ABX8S560_9ACTN|nr:hypothetical protein [Skermania piniformis]QXQ12984.1 hypothetical protein KV203_13825 [Skermania piniformis]
MYRPVRNCNNSNARVRVVGRVVAAGTVAAAALSLAACGSTESTAGSATPTLPPLPTAQELNDRLAQGLDPAVPVEDKARWVQGGDEDPQLLNRIADLYRKEGASIVVTKVTDLGGGRVEAAADFTLWNEVHPQVVPFVAEDGEWKVDKSYACSVIQFAQLSSPACNDQPG